MLACLGGGSASTASPTAGLVTPAWRSGWAIRSQYRNGQHKKGKSSQHKRRKHTDFAAQPYEQLADMYRQSGQDAEARDVAIARRRDLRTYGNLNWYARFGNAFLDKTIRYGYQTWRAGVGLAVVFLAFLVLSIIGQHRHMIVPVADTGGLNTRRRPPPDAPAITLASTRSGTRLTRSSRSSTCTRPITGAQTVTRQPGGVWVVGAWGATAAGGVLATLLVAGYTGLVRQELTPLSEGCHRHHRVERAALATDGKGASLDGRRHADAGRRGGDRDRGGQRRWGAMPAAPPRPACSPARTTLALAAETIGFATPRAGWPGRAAGRHRRRAPG